MPSQPTPGPLFGRHRRKPRHHRRPDLGAAGHHAGVPGVPQRLQLGHRSHHRRTRAAVPHRAAEPDAHLHGGAQRHPALRHRQRGACGRRGRQSLVGLPLPLRRHRQPRPRPAAVRLDDQPLPPVDPRPLGTREHWMAGLVGPTPRFTAGSVGSFVPASKSPELVSELSSCRTWHSVPGKASRSWPSPNRTRYVRGAVLAPNLEDLCGLVRRPHLEYLTSSPIDVSRAGHPD